MARSHSPQVGSESKGFSTTRLLLAGLLASGCARATADSAVEPPTPIASIQVNPSKPELVCGPMGASYDMSCYVDGDTFPTVCRLAPQGIICGDLTCAPGDCNVQ